jgi:phosphopantothenoylcysteine decarboxylase/phosphopantothenate--cysteine ligase
MRCLVTAGPTYEPVDQVRRLTNFSTGRLGGELANYLADQGHTVHLLLAETATWNGRVCAQTQERFSTTSDLRARLERLCGSDVQAVFHAAAVSDFASAGVWERGPGGEFRRVQAGKLPSQAEGLFLELRPTPKLIRHLRAWFPEALIVGWKYEVDGVRREALARALSQLRACRTSACVVNGPAYGPGYGVVHPDGRAEHQADAGALYGALQRLALNPPAPVAGPGNR